MLQNMLIFLLTQMFNFDKIFNTKGFLSVLEFIEGIQSSSVADPEHFGTDTDPRTWIGFYSDTDPDPF